MVVHSCADCYTPLRATKGFSETYRALHERSTDWKKTFSFDKVERARSRGVGFESPVRSEDTVDIVCERMTLMDDILRKKAAGDVEVQPSVSQADGCAGPVACSAGPSRGAVLGMPAARAPKKVDKGKGIATEGPKKRTKKAKEPSIPAVDEAVPPPVSVPQEIDRRAVASKYFSRVTQFREPSVPVGSLDHRDLYMDASTARLDVSGSLILYVFACHFRVTCCFVAVHCLSECAGDFVPD